MKHTINLEEFVRQNAPYLTLSDMVEETGESLYTIRSKCIELGITPIKGKDQTKQFIFDHYTYKTPQQIAKLLGCGEANLRQFYKELNIPFGKKQFEKFVELSEQSENVKRSPLVKRPTVREILGSFQVDASIHYQDVKRSSNW